MSGKAIPSWVQAVIAALSAVAILLGLKAAFDELTFRNRDRLEAEVEAEVRVEP